SRKGELEKVKEAAIRSEEEREQALVVKVGEIECLEKKGRAVLKVTDAEVKGLSTMDEGVGVEMDTG
ncbi:hypothetical protein A2U01_0114244, partial [Trifolium medium]|nr:hypothetical protein [Trifolium medium]